MSLVEKILKSIEFGNELLLGIDHLKYLPYQLMWGSSLQGYNRKSVQATLSRLVNQGLVKKTLHKEKTYLALTDLGESFLQRQKLLNTRLELRPKEEKWDGLYRFVLFDIPERERLVRDTLRNALKVLGAVCWQRSVWVTKQNITRELSEFIDENGLDDYCTILEVKEIYNGKLKKLLDKGY